MGFVIEVTGHRATQNLMRALKSQEPVYESHRQWRPAVIPVVLRRVKLGGGVVQGQPRAYGEFPVSKISGDVCKVSEYICPCFAQWTTVILSCREYIPIPLVESR